MVSGPRKLGRKSTFKEFFNIDGRREALRRKIFERLLRWG